MASRDISELRPETAAKARLFVEACEFAGLPVLIVCTYRSNEEQARLYCAGRTKGAIQAKALELDRDYGRPDLADLLLTVHEDPAFKPGPSIVTNAGPGQSTHNYRAAIDFVPLVDGKPFWRTETPEDLALWGRYGKIGVDAGFEWAGNWRSFREYGHLEEPLIDWRTRIRDGSA